MDALKSNHESRTLSYPATGATESVLSLLEGPFPRRLAYEGKSFQMDFVFLFYFLQYS